MKCVFYYFDLINITGVIMIFSIIRVNVKGFFPPSILQLCKPSIFYIYGSVKHSGQLLELCFCLNVVLFYFVLFLPGQGSHRQPSFCLFQLEEYKQTSNLLTFKEIHLCAE